jgi:uncharacterized NAD(P)/FAD-binding protein YdhS
MDDINQVDSNELSDDQIDGLLNETAPSADIPMKAEQAPAQTPQEYSLKVGGKEIKAPLDKVLHWAQMGYEYPQKAQEWNQTKSQLDQYRQKEKQLQEIEQKWKPYKEVDEFAAKNPDWWQQVQAQYQQKIQAAADQSRNRPA